MLPDQVSNPGPLTYESGALKKKKNVSRSFVTVMYFLFTSVILLIFLCLKITYLKNFIQLFSKSTAQIVVKFHMKHDQNPEFLS